MVSVEFKVECSFTPCPAFFVGNDEPADDSRVVSEVGIIRRGCVGVGYLVLRSLGSRGVRV